MYSFPLLMPTLSLLSTNQPEGSQPPVFLFPPVTVLPGDLEGDKRAYNNAPNRNIHVIKQQLTSSFAL
jgi:hypothetical protein